MLDPRIIQYSYAINIHQKGASSLMSALLTCVALHRLKCVNYDEHTYFLVSNMELP